MAFIKINRKFFDGKFWKQKRTFSQAEAWIDLIQSARFEAETETRLLANGREICIKRGEIHASLRYLADRWGWGVEKTKRFIDIAINENAIERRIEHGESIITLINYDIYNELKNEYRTPTSTPTSTPTEHPPVQTKELKKDKNILPPLTPPQVGGEKVKTWKDDFDIYLSELREAFRDVQKNDKWLKQQQSFYPKVDIIKSIEKSCVNFWGTEAGWKHKKKSRYKSVDWNSTFANSISQNQNKVYKTAYDEQQDNLFTY